MEQIFTPSQIEEILNIKTPAEEHNMTEEEYEGYKKRMRIRNRANRLNNSEPIKCGCGSTIKKYKLKQHYTTDKHKKYLKSLE
jgi:hypothetical protein